MAKSSALNVHNFALLQLKQLTSGRGYILIVNYLLLITAMVNINLERVHLNDYLRFMCQFKVFKSIWNV